MDRMTLLLGNIREAMSNTYILDPQCFAQLKTDGLFMQNVCRYNQPLDVSSYVAAQNAYGWNQRDEVFVPHGSSHSALMLNNIQFSIPKALFTPLHKPPPDGSQGTRREQ
jgi:hypothetical protein